MGSGLPFPPHDYRTTQEGAKAEADRRRERMTARGALIHELIFIARLPWRLLPAIWHKARGKR